MNKSIMKSLVASNSFLRLSFFLLGYTSDEIDIQISEYRFSVIVKGKYRLIDHVRTTHRGDLEVCVSAMWIS